MAYHVIRYIADKHKGDGEDKIEAVPSIQYTRERRSDAEQILTKLYEISANQKTMQIIKRTRYTFRCENRLHRYYYKVTNGTGKTKEELLSSEFI